MSVVEKLKSVVGMADSNPKYVYECNECDREFDSYKVEQRAFCSQCMSNDVTRIGER